MVKSVEWTRLSWTSRLPPWLALRVQGSGIFARAMRVPVEWISDTDAQGNLRLAATRAELDGYLGRESHVTRPLSRQPEQGTELGWLWARGQGREAAGV